MNAGDALGKRIPRAFFVLLTPLLMTSFLAQAANCVPRGPGSSAIVARIIDGDTLDLTDGRRVRLIGINAPELGHGRAPDQPLARAAREQLAELVAVGGRSDTPTVTLYFGAERRDRHGRWLAHVSRGGRSVERELTRDGLAYHVAIPPNLVLAPCLRDDERAARSAGRGLWNPALPGPVASAAVAAGGYQRVRGRVERIAFADAWWIEFAGGFTAVIYPEHQRWWDRETLSGWRGQTIEVRGWVYPARRGGWRMKLPTPDARLL